LSSLLAQVHPHAVVQLLHVAQVFHLANSGQKNTIQQDGKNIHPISDMLGENEAFSFGLIWIDIGTKLQIFAGSKLLADLDPCLKP
jgi:hypothetical protein